MSTLFIFNESPQHSEKSFHGLRLATALAKRGQSVPRIFLFADGVHLTATVRDARFDVAPLLAALHEWQVPLAACKSCLGERGIAADVLPPGIVVATLDDAADWTTQADRILVY